MNNNNSSFVGNNNYDDKKNVKTYKFRKILLLIIAVTVHNIPGKLSVQKLLF